MIQRIHVVCTTATPAEAAALRRRLSARALAVVGPTAECAAVVRALGLEDVRPEVLLVPVAIADRDRGHRLDALVRTHAMADRARELVVVTDPESAARLIRAFSGREGEGHRITELGLPRSPEPPNGWAVTAIAVTLALASGLLSSAMHILALPSAALLLGGALWLLPGLRRAGTTALLGAGISLILVILSVASSARFPNQ